jgi:hypothetical protein
MGEASVALVTLKRSSQLCSI